MATKGLVLHVVTVGTTKIGIKEPDNYDGIASIVGVKKATPTEKVDDSATIGELKLRGKAMTLNVRLADGKSRKVICAIDKVAAAISGLVGKTYATQVIKSASIPRRRTRR